jgi:hypothetical protein
MSHICHEYVFVRYVLRSSSMYQGLLCSAASIAVGLSFLRCGGASQPAKTESRKTHVAHRRIKIERVYRPYLTATEAVCSVVARPTEAAQNSKFSQNRVRYLIYPEHQKFIAHLKLRYSQR